MGILSGDNEEFSDLVELLTVDDHFRLAAPTGLVVRPDFPLPDGWKARVEPVVIVTSDGRSRELMAHFLSAHFSIPNPAKAEMRWRLVVPSPEADKKAVPIGSKVMTSDALRAAIVAGQLSK